jgi:uncharacterized protein
MIRWRAILGKGTALTDPSGSEPLSAAALAALSPVHRPHNIVRRHHRVRHVAAVSRPEARHRRRRRIASNVEIAKKAYEAYGAGDVETALSTFDDDIEWSVPGNSTLSGTYRGKEKLKELLGKLAEKSFTTTLDRILGDGDDVVVITKITAREESGLQADVLSYRDGKLVKP